VLETDYVMQVHVHAADTILWPHKKSISKLYREITKPVRKRHMMEGTIKTHNIRETGCDEDAYS
jgi:hypothetical protein